MDDRPDIAAVTTTPFADGAQARRAASQVERQQGDLTKLSAQRIHGISIDSTATIRHGVRDLLARVRDAPTRVGLRMRRSDVASRLEPLIQALRTIAAPSTYRTILRRRAMQTRSSVVDAFGLDPVYVDRCYPAFELLYRAIWRVETQGVANIADHGRVMIVANRSEALPFDATMLMYALRYDHPGHRTLRPLLDDATFHAPFVGPALNRLGCVRACPQNASRLLLDDQIIAIFPEHAPSAPRRRGHRHQLQQFGRGGFVKLALRTGCPIIPAALVGIERAPANPARLLTRIELLGLLAGAVAPAMPWIGLVGQLPPLKEYRLRFGSPIRLAQDHDSGAADDPLLVARISEEIRLLVQSMADDAQSPNADGRVPRRRCEDVRTD